MPACPSYKWYGYRSVRNEVLILNSEHVLS